MVATFGACICDHNLTLGGVATLGVLGVKLYNAGLYIIQHSVAPWFLS